MKGLWNVCGDRWVEREQCEKLIVLNFDSDWD